MESEFVRIVTETIVAERMARDETVLVAVSGGVDSVVLLDVLTRVGADLGLELHVFHLDHRLRGRESEADARFVSGLAAERGLPCTVASHDVARYAREHRLSLESAAREVRYHLMERTARSVGASRVALAHHADDQVETFLMRLMRGTGLDGLRGIPPVRDQFIRPLIRVSKHDVMEYARSCGLSWREDSSNQDTRHFRNLVRLRLLPAIEEVYPDFRQGVLRTMAVATEECEHAEAEAACALALMALSRPWGMSLSGDQLSALPRPVAARVLRRAIRQVRGHLADVERRHLLPALDALPGATKFVTELPGGVVLAGQYGEVGVLTSTRPAGGTHEELRIPGRTQLPALGVAVTVWIAEGRASSTETVLPGRWRARLTAGAVERRLVVRTRRPGDRLRLGPERGSKKLHDILIDDKVPVWRRDWLPVVESDGDLVAVAGVRVSSAWAAGQSDERALVVEFEPLTEETLGAGRSAAGHRACWGGGSRHGSGATALF